MRILHISDFYLPRLGGIERVIAALVHQQRLANQQPEVLTRRLSPEAEAEVVIDGVRVHRLAGAAGRAPLHYADVCRSARHWGRAELARFDLVHAHLTLTTLGVLQGVSSRGIPLVASFYGPWHREYLVEQGPGGLAQPDEIGLSHLVRLAMAAFMRWAQGRVLEAARRIVTLSSHSAGELAEFGFSQLAGKCRVVPGGSESVRFNPEAASELVESLPLVSSFPVILAVRRLVPRMGWELLFEAFSAVKARWPRALLLLAGEGPLRQQLERRAKAAGGVLMLGAVPEEDLPGLYARADLVVMPTRALEGFGLPVLEAWSCGTRVVGTPVGSLPELLKLAHGGFVAERACGESLGRAMSWALELDRGEWRERLRELAGKYEWAEIAARTREVYQEAVGVARP